MKKNNLQKGFTLVESLVYVVVFALISISLAEITISVTRAFNSIRSTQAVESNASDILNRISRDIKNSTSIIAASSSFNVNLGSLALSSKDDSGNIRNIEYYVDSNNMLQVKENGVSLGKITSSSTPISSLIFSQINTNNSIAIKVGLSLKTLKDKATTTEDFGSTYVLRGSY